MSATACHAARGLLLASLAAGLLACEDREVSVTIRQMQPLDEANCAPATVADEIGDGGGGALKGRLTDAINTELAPLRARRAELEADPGYLIEVLRRGNTRANEVAETTLDEVREAMGMVYE